MRTLARGWVHTLAPGWVHTLAPSSMRLRAVSLLAVSARAPRRSFVHGVGTSGGSAASCGLVTPWHWQGQSS